jgi:hypothetical protein
MPKKPVTEAITAFLRGRREEHPGKDLLDRYLEHGCDLETQVNVAAGDSEPVAGKRATWDTGTYQYWNLRIPKNAYDEPEFKDYKLSWPLELHADGIGTTGWHWKDRKSLWVGFDFDAITGHAAGVGITDEQLAEVQRAAEDLPYTEVRKSTGGKGIHLYTLLDGIPTSNHTEHAALARCILGMMSAETGFDFARQIDCCGSIMWFWHRKMTQENQGLALLKPAEKVLTIEDLPANWKDHVDVVSKRRAKVRVNGLSDEEQDPFDKLASARLTVDLDETHKATIDELAQSGFSTVWVQDYHLLQTHTVALQMLMQDEDVRKKLNLKGYFITNSRGSNPAEPNCFAFPLRNGAWKVYRFGQGINEDVTWTQDGEGWTTCLFNHDPDFMTAARAKGGAELADCKGYQFDKVKYAIDVARTLGSPDIVLDEKFLFREATLRQNKDGRLVMRIEKEKDEAKPGDGWVKVARGGYWEKVFNVRTETNEDDQGVTDYDERLRRLNTPTGDTAGWFVKDTTAKWARCTASDARMWLQQHGHPKTQAEEILGGCIDRPWTLINHPFGDEYPGKRQWNYNTPTYKFKPAELDVDQHAHHPHWDKILRHCFCDLDSEIKDLQWAQDANIRTGADYGLAWIACCFRDPFEPLPFLFFFGNQDCGKSIFHEALALLTTGGIVSAERSLTNQSGFNGELANAVIAYIEESDIAKSPYAYPRMKEWTTAKVLWIRRMRTDAYPQPNTLHMVMMANDQRNCPVFPGDTRITVIEVPDLLKEEQIPKSILIKKLEEEAPHFMHTLKSFELPKVQGRLRLPVIDTYKKQQSEDMNRSPLESFLKEQIHFVPGEKELFSQFYERFIEWIDPEERYQWSKIKVSRGLPSDTPCGASTDNKRFVGNISFAPVEPKPDAVPYVCINGRLRIKE